MLNTKKVRIYLDEELKQLLAKLFGCSRKTYNLCLGKSIENKENVRKFLTQLELQKEFHSQFLNEHEYLQEFNSNILKVEIQILSLTQTKFIKGKCGFPHFKSKYDRQSTTFINPTCISRNNLVDGKINLTKNIKGISFRTSDRDTNYILKNRQYIKRITISKEKDNTYYASMLFNTDEKELNKKIQAKAKNFSVGVDLGLKTYLTCSNGEVYENKRFLEKEEKKLKRYQRKLSKLTLLKKQNEKESGIKSEKDSLNIKNVKLKINKIQRRIRNKKLDYIHNITTQLVNDNQVIIVETLNVEGMLQNHKLAKSIQQVNMGEFIEILKYKCEWYGRVLIKVDQWFPSSKICSKCGYKNNELTLGDREWICPDCGIKHDRDLNASINIQKEGLIILNELLKTDIVTQNIIGRWSPDFKSVEFPSGNHEAGTLSLKSTIF